MMDVTELAKITALSLSPALPYLLHGGTQIMDGTFKKIGADTWDVAKNVWKKLTFRSDSTADDIKKAAADAADNPSDEDAKSALIFQIKKLLKSDSQLCADLVNIFEQTKTKTDIRVGGVHFDGATVINSGNISGGNQYIGRKEEED